MQVWLKKANIIMQVWLKKVNIVLSVLLALGLLFMAAPEDAGAEIAENDQATAVKFAGDWLAANQNTDGGFGWTLPTGDKSYTNVLGVTALGILSANEFENKAAYETALAKAYKYLVDNPAVYTWDIGQSKYVESTFGVDSSPDFTFLIWLASEAAADSTLLTAINDLQDPDITPDDIANLAKSRWDEKVARWASTQQHPLDGTATLVAERLRDGRHTSNLDSAVTWDIELAITAAYALDAYFPGEGYDQHALDMVEVLYASVDDGTYFDSTDSTQSDYVIGLTGAIRAFAETGQHLDKAASLKTILLSLQQADGSWNYYGTTPATKSVQSTAYAVMALNTLGDPDSVLAANQAAGWMVKNQKLDGGWYAEAGAETD